MARRCEITGKGPLVDIMYLMHTIRQRRDSFQIWEE